MHCSWFDSGYMLFERLWTNLHIFYVAVNSNPEAFGLHSRRLEKRAQSMLLVVVSLSAVRTWKLSIISASAPFLTVCSIFRALDGEEFFVIEGSLGWRGRQESDSQVTCHTQISSWIHCIAHVM